MLLCTILQNLSQAEEVWGKDRADTILANHRARLFGPGIGDTATLEYISRILGDEVRETTSISRKRAAVIDLGSRSESLEHRTLLGHHEIRQLPDWFLIYGQLPPTEVTLRPWFQSRRLSRLVAGAAPTGERIRGSIARLQTDDGVAGRLRALRGALSARVDRVDRARGAIAGRSPRQEARKVGVTVQVQLGHRTNGHLSFGVRGTPRAAQVTTPQIHAAAPEPVAATITPVIKPAAPAKVQPAAKKPAAAAAAAGAEVQAPVVNELLGQLTLDDAGGAPQEQATKPPRGPREPDVRGRLDRILGDHATAAVAALRLATQAGDDVALTGPLALVLQNADEIPADGPWDIAELLVAQKNREAVTERLLKLGAASNADSDEWIAPSGARLQLHTHATAAAALSSAETLAIDGVGPLRVLSSEALSAGQASAYPRR